MAKRTGISLVSSDGGLLQWKLGDGSLVELNRNKCDSVVRDAAEVAGFHRAISNIGAGKDKANWPAIRAEMNRRIRGMLAGQFKTNVGGYGFADHVEAVIRLAAKTGKPATYENVTEKLLAMTPEQRTEHAANKHVALIMKELIAERARNALNESEDDADDALDGLI